MHDYDLEQRHRVEMVLRLHRLPAGQEVQMSRREFQELFPPVLLTGQTGIERLQESLVGSAYGHWDIAISHETGQVRIHRLK